jgi:hypothetical protein
MKRHHLSLENNTSRSEGDSKSVADLAGQMKTGQIGILQRADVNEVENSFGNLVPWATWKGLWNNSAGREALQGVRDAVLANSEHDTYGIPTIPVSMQSDYLCFFRGFRIRHDVIGKQTKNGSTY